MNALGKYHILWGKGGESLKKISKHISTLLLSNFIMHFYSILELLFRITSIKCNIKVLKHFLENGSKVYGSLHTYSTNSMQMCIILQRHLTRFNIYAIT